MSYHLCINKNIQNILLLGCIYTGSKNLTWGWLYSEMVTFQEEQGSQMHCIASAMFYFLKREGAGLKHRDRTLFVRAA